MFNSMYYKCALAQKLAGDKAEYQVGYGFTMSVSENILVRVTLSVEEDIEKRDRTQVQR